MPIEGLQWTLATHACAVDRMTISLTSTSAGCPIANAIAFATTSGAIANVSMEAASCALTSEFVTVSAKLVRV